MTIAQVINSYWKGVAKVLPEPFDPNTSPKDWVIQKGPGAFAINGVLPRAVEVVRARGHRLGDPDAYAEVMAGLTELSGEVTDERGQPISVAGAGFWRSGSQGVAGLFSGHVGRKRLFLKIQALLPKPSDEIAL